MKIRDILRTKGPEVLSIAPDESVLTAVRILSRERIGALVVRANDAVVGIISERDVLDLAADDPHKLEATRVEEVMTADVLVGVADDELDSIMAVMTENRIRHLPIMEDGRLAGIVSIGDVVNAMRRTVEAENRHLWGSIEGGYG